MDRHGGDTITEWRIEGKRRRRNGNFLRVQEKRRWAVRSRRNSSKSSGCVGGSATSCRWLPQRQAVQAKATLASLSGCPPWRYLVLTTKQQSGVRAFCLFVLCTIQQ